MRDCMFLLADSNMKAAFEGFLNRDSFHHSLGCGQFSFAASRDLRVASGDNDPGLYTRGHELLRPYVNTHRFAVIVLDEEWYGSPGVDTIREHITTNLLKTGWRKENCRVIVVDPELEMWIWQRNDHVAKALGMGSSREFETEPIISEAWPQGQLKPSRPKETLEAVLRKNHIPRSSSIYRRITSRVSVKSCQDGSFQELSQTLQAWFPLERQAL